LVEEALSHRLISEQKKPHQLALCGFLIC